MKTPSQNAGLVHSPQCSYATGMEERVILVDEAGREIGSEAKLTAHRLGRLHRAFSVFVFDSGGRLMLQRRATGKYHSGGLWSNTCCGHPRPGEETCAAAARRLREEMGFECLLEPAGEFIYWAELGDELIEHEYDHVFIGWLDGTPEPDPDEVAEWRFASLGQIRREIAVTPDAFTAWFGQALARLQESGKLPAS